MRQKIKKWSEKEDDLIITHIVNKRKPWTMTQMKAWFDNLGFDRTQDAIRNRAYLLRRDKLVGAHHRRQGWLDGARWGYFDIETCSGFKANFGNMISWAMYIPDKPGVYQATRVEPLVYNLGEGYGQIDAHNNGVVLYDAITRREAIDHTKFDKRIVGTLCEAFKRVDILVGYYSTKFDVPYIRTQAVHHGHRFPLYQEKVHLDLYYTVRNLFQLSRNSLDQACSYFGIEGKTHVDYAIWQAARVGNKEALEYVLNHNIEDVQILAELHNKIGGFRNVTRRSL
jgi:DNA polymerase elongation subunit (family B)